MKGRWSGLLKAGFDPRLFTGSAEAGFPPAASAVV